MEILEVSTTEEYRPEQILEYVQESRGLIWDRIEDFQNQLKKIEGFL